MKIRCALLFVLAAATVASAQVTLPRILSSHMVVERDLPVHVWGMAAPDEAVSVEFRGERRTAKADRLGRWSAYLTPGAAGGPFAMTVRGASGPAIALEDILVGDVWLASGQSNMEFEMYKAATAAQDLPHAANPQIRLLIVKRDAAEYAKDDMETEGWKASTPESAHDFSAVAWYFAREIEAREHVPVGVIDSTVGGTLADAWTRMAALGEDAALAPVFAERGKMTDREVASLLTDVDRKKQVEEAKAQGKPTPQFPWHPPLATWAPGGLWNGMISPLTPFAIRGVIWYQGESNSALARAPLYNRVFRTLIEDWRRQWGIGDFPFLYVQIANFKSTPQEDWAALRAQQVQTLGLRNTAMAVTVDIGNPDDVHPTDKVDVGHRLALAARALSYGEAVGYQGPMFRQATTEGGAIRAWFDHAAGLTTKNGELAAFEVAGSDGKFHAASAKLDGATVVATSPEVAEPLLVRYGWSNSPQCNLFNGDGLPASPFTSER